MNLHLPAGRGCPPRGTDRRWIPRSTRFTTITLGFSDVGPSRCHRRNQQRINSVHGNDVPVAKRGPHAITLDANIHGGCHRSPQEARMNGVSTLGRPEHLVDGLASVHQLLGVVGRNLNFAGRTEFGVPEGVVEVRDGFKVLRQKKSVHKTRLVLALLRLLSLTAA